MLRHRAVTMRFLLLLLPCVAFAQQPDPKAALQSCTDVAQSYRQELQAAHDKLAQTVAAANAEIRALQEKLKQKDK